MRILVIEASVDEILEMAGVFEPPPNSNPVSHSEIRAWAKERGFVVSKTGALPKDLIELFYQEVHS